MRVFKSKQFDRFARQAGIDDAALLDAVDRPDRGLIDADLGGAVIKQRIARPGEGRSGGVRTTIFFKRADRAFLVGFFEKKDKGNIERQELKGFRLLAGIELNWTDSELAKSGRRGVRHRNVWQKGGPVTRTYVSPLMGQLHEHVSDLHGIGLIDKKTMREFDEACLTPIAEMTPEAIHELRERERASQAVFARYLNVPVSLVSQWERGEKRPNGPSLKLLSLIKAKGLYAIA